VNSDCTLPGLRVSTRRKVPHNSNHPGWGWGDEDYKRKCGRVSRNLSRCWSLTVPPTPNENRVNGLLGGTGDYGGKSPGLQKDGSTRVFQQKVWGLKKEGYTGRFGVGGGGQGEGKTIGHDTGGANGQWLEMKEGISML